MSESAVILEGEVARRFNPVDKLRVTNQDSSVSDWVPSDTLDLGSLMASENTLYLANIDDDCDAYEEVEVDVSEELEDGDYKKITGKGNDGNDYAVGLDENGNLTSEMVPSAIHIVIKPRKLEYKEGETLDFTGIHVYLMDGNNQRFTSEDYPSGEIPFGELIFPVIVAELSTGRKTTSDLDITPLDSVTEGGAIALTFLYKGDEIGSDVVSIRGSAEHVFYQYTKNGDYNGFTIIFASSSPTATYGYTYKLHTGSKIITEHSNDATVNTQFTHNGKTVYMGSFGITTPSYYTKVDGSFGYEYILPNSPVLNLSHVAWTMVYGTEEGEEGEEEIPVQWMRSDGESLEDKFNIIIVSDGEETGDTDLPQPDPYVGYADVSYNGHFYNINRKKVPQIHYANGYVWQEGISTEFSIEQAASLGLLILVR